jgi:hypothetical protein
MRRRAARHRDALAFAASLLLLASCELESLGTGDAFSPLADASTAGTSGAGGGADAGLDRDALEPRFDGGDEPADAAADGAADGSAVCGMDPPAPGGFCPLECTGGCWGAKCYIGCATALSCQNALVRCPTGFDCEVGCFGLRSCFGARIQCEARQACRVNCVGVDACQGATVHCGNGSCAMSCHGTSCSGTTMNCGPGDCQALCFSSPYPTVNCQGACNCSPC